MGGHQNSRILLNWRWGRPEKPELSAQSQNSTMVGGGLSPYPQRSQASPMPCSWSLLGCLPTCSPWKDSLGTISFSPGKN